tara:strand:+ start:248 stop:454 length:207 start_codon:yes stop_codon:yes gene_type:complete
MHFKEYQTHVSDRFDAMSEEDQVQVIELLKTPSGRMVISVLGNELLNTNIIEETPIAPVRRGLAAPLI